MYELINGREIETVDVSAGEPKRRPPASASPARAHHAASEQAEIDRYIARNQVPAP